ncbi:MAG: hypothetical protein ACPLPS_06060 [bacterium]
MKKRGNGRQPYLKGEEEKRRQEELGKEDRKGEGGERKLEED